MEKPFLLTKRNNMINKTNSFVTEKINRPILKNSRVYFQ